MPKILIVDDDPALLAVIDSALKAAGHETCTAGDGRQAQQQLKTFPADLVLTDLVMPEKEGLEFLIELRRNGPAPRVIAMSGAGGVVAGEYLRHAKMLGAAATLTKPFRIDTLLRLVAEVLRGGAETRQAGAVNRG